MADKRCIINLPRTRRSWLLLGAALGMAALALFFALPGGQKDAGQPPAFSLEEAAKGLNRYDITLRLLPEEHTLTLTETLSYRNDTGETLDHLVLRTWINAFQSEETSPAAAEEIYDACYPGGFSAGGLALYDVQWNGEAAAHAYLDDAMTALRVEVPPLAPGEEGALFLRSVITVPDCAYRTGRVGNDYQLGNAIPLLSRWEEGAWRTDPYSAVGDPFLSDCANFSIALYLPEGYDAQPGCSCLLTRDEAGVWRGEMPAARDIALCLSPGACLKQGWAGDTRVLSFAPSAAGADRALGYALKALETFGALYGAYPYPALTVCSADFPFGGMEYPGLIMIGESNYLESRADTLELEVAHETAHQWFYALVGSDQVKDPWQDEALCQYAVLSYVCARYGQGSFESLKSYRVDAPMQETLPGTLTPGSPIDYFSSLSDYASVVYGRGAALLLAADQWLEGGMNDFLRAYAEKYAFGFATRADFEALLNDYAQADLTPLVVDYLDTAME